MDVWENIAKEEQEEEEQELIQLGEVFKKRLAENNGRFSEELTLTPQGKISLKTKEGELASKFAHIALFTQGENQGSGFESVFKLASKINEKFPELQFGFEQNPERNILTYTVTNPPTSPSK